MKSVAEIISQFQTKSIVNLIFFLYKNLLAVKSYENNVCKFNIFLSKKKRIFINDDQIKYE